MSAQDFGADVKRCRGSVSLSTLAGCMFSRAGFAPASVGSAADLEQCLQAIEAGDPWPFTPSDLLALMHALLPCLQPVLSIAAEVSLSFSAGIYYAELCRGP